MSVAQPACHGRGFISLCQENPKLRVERCVSLWKNVWPVSLDCKRLYMTGAQFHGEISDPEGDQLCAEDVTRSVGEWLAEAMALPTLGMPVGSYTPMLDGSPTLEHTSKVFHIV